jgi:hypothetical protein
LIKSDVNFGKGKIKGIASISRKYWDKGALTTNVDKILLKGEKTSFELNINEVRSIERVRHRTFKVIKITMHNDDYYHVSHRPDENISRGRAEQYLEEIVDEVKAYNKVLYNKLQQFLNP